MFLTAALLTILQVIAKPVLHLILGQDSLIPLFIVAASYLGMAIGASGFFPRPNRLIYLVLGAGLMATGVAFGRTSAILLQPGLAIFVAPLFFFVTVVSGWLLAVELYHRPDGHSFTVKHSRLNLVGAFTVLATTGAMYLWGLRAAIIAAGFLLAVNFFRGFSKRINVAASVSRSLAVTIFSGIISSGLLVFFFHFAESAFLSGGYSYYIYLFLVFAFLGFSRFLLKVFPRGGTANSAWLLVLAFISACSLTVLFAGYRYSAGPVVDPVLLYLVLPNWARHFGLVAGVLFAILFSPYLFLAALVPAREDEAPGENHIFGSLFGNLAGLLIFTITGLALNYYSQLIFVAILILLYVFFSTRKKVTVALAAATMAIPLLILSPEVERGGIVLNLRLLTLYWSPYAQEDAFLKLHIQQYPPSRVHIDFLEKSYGVNTAVASYSEKAILILGGYSFPLHHPFDFNRADVLEEYMTRVRPARVLILGLGNHIIVSGAARALAKGNLQTEVSVVDNYLPFRDRNLRISIGRSNGFNWDNPQVRFISADAINYLAANKESFDLIVWNLAFTYHPSGKKLYTENFSGILRASLKAGGVFMGQDILIPKMNCALYSAFPEVYFSADMKEAISLASLEAGVIKSFPAGFKMNKSLCAAEQRLTFNSVYEIFIQDHLNEIRKGYW